MSARTISGASASASARRSPAGPKIADLPAYRAMPASTPHLLATARNAPFSHARALSMYSSWALVPAAERTSAVGSMRSRAPSTARRRGTSTILASAHTNIPAFPDGSDTTSPGRPGRNHPESKCTQEHLVADRGDPPPPDRAARPSSARRRPRRGPAPPQPMSSSPPLCRIPRAPARTTPDRGTARPRGARSRGRSPPGGPPSRRPARPRWPPPRPPRGPCRPPRPHGPGAGRRRSS